MLKMLDEMIESHNNVITFGISLGPVEYYNNMDTD